MASTLSFHIRHEVSPERCQAVFEAIAAGSTYQHILQHDRQEARLRQLGLVADEQLTETGQALWTICQQKPALWGDLLHYTHYSLWQPEHPTVHGFSWLYRQFTHLLWQAHHTTIDDEFLKPAVNELIGRAEAEPAFAASIVGATRGGTVSLSPASLQGALHWLEALQPPVISEQHFECRSFCPPELLLLALGWVAQKTGAELGIDMLLTPERREAIGKLCLVDLPALDRLVDWTLPSYPSYIRAGTRAGSYGRFVRFIQWPSLTSLVAS